MSRRLSGINPLSYLGVEPYTPPAMLQNARTPTTNDFANLGDFWLVVPPGYTGPESLWVLISLQAGTATWVQLYPGSAGSIEFETDAGTVNPNMGVVNVLGDGVKISTTGSGNTIVIHGDSDVATDYVTDSGTATPSSSTLNVVGGVNMNTSGSGNTVVVTLNDNVGLAGNLGVDGATLLGGTVTVTTFTEGVVQSDNSGNLSSTAGTNGQILIGATGAAPEWANITSTGATVTITNNANSINLETVGGGGGNTIISQFTSSGTWTKNVATQYIEVYGWNAGGGGSSGAIASFTTPNGGGGGAGGSYGYFGFEGPEFCFPASETITIGSGGVGGVPQTVVGQPGNAGGNGGVTSFGALTTVSAIQSTTIGGPQSGGGDNIIGGNTTSAGFIGEYLSEGISLTDQNSSVTSNIGIGNNPGAHRQYGAGGNAANTITSAYFGNRGRNGGWGAVYPNVQGNVIVNIPATLYRMPTNGGGGAGQNFSAPAAYNGGAAGSMLAPGNLTTLIAGGTAGLVAGPQDGGDGNPGLVGVGVMCGGTGGGGGSSEFSGNPPGKGGNGAFPGAGGGGGGASLTMDSGAGGDGANGLIIIVEYL